MRLNWILWLLMAGSLACLSVCGRTFATSQAFKVHKASCTHVRAAFASASQQAESAPDGQALYLAKRRRLNPEPPSQPIAGPSSEPMNTEFIQKIDSEQPDEPMPSREPSPDRQPTPPPQVTATGRPIRAKRKTWKLLQQLPETPLTVAETAADTTPEPVAQSTSTWVWQALRTSVNSFALFREYPSVPTYNPDELISELDPIQSSYLRPTPPFQPPRPLLRWRAPPPKQAPRRRAHFVTRVSSA
ncbi:hypothetical protein B0H13DRAFT_1852308 [Mycena leptocephala]|nr:hypothetical protein B0H13DRAFT_1852308 [Mycena leptocephala]